VRADCANTVRKKHGHLMLMDLTCSLSSSPRSTRPLDPTVVPPTSETTGDSRMAARPLLRAGGDPEARCRVAIIGAPPLPSERLLLEGGAMRADSEPVEADDETGLDGGEQTGSTAGDEERGCGCNTIA